MVGQHHQLNGHEFEQTPGDREGHGNLACCSPWGRKKLDTPERLNNNMVALLSVFKEPPYYSLQRWYQCSFSPTVQEGPLLFTPSPSFIVVHVLMIAILTRVRWYLIIILICISLIISNIEHHYMCLLAIHISSLGKCLIQGFCPLDWVVFVVELFELFVSFGN